MTKIGPQSGIKALVNWLTKMGEWQEKFAAWAALPDATRPKTPPVPPKLAWKRGPNYNPIDLTSWPVPEKIERTLEILVADHDGAVTGPTGPTGATGPAPFKRVAPITVREEGGSDQRVCLFNASGELRPGVRRLPSGQYTDDSGALYAANGDGLEDSGVRTKVHDPALVGARSMDGRSACQCPTVGSPSLNTGSWTV